MMGRVRESPKGPSGIAHTVAEGALGPPDGLVGPQRPAGAPFHPT